MTLQTKITQDDLYLYEIIKNPVLCGEFINNLDKSPIDEPFEFTDYQQDMLCDFNQYVNFTCARAVGKTVVIWNLIVWSMVNNIFPDDYFVYHVPNKVHAEPVFTSLIKAFRTNSFLMNMIKPNEGINRSEMSIRLVSGSTLFCRVAGQSGTGSSVVGIHSPLEFADEAGYYPYGTWIELLPTFNQFTLGSRLLVSGVPTGMREKNVLFQTDQEDSLYTHHRISALRNPRFTEEDDNAAAERYGGRDSDDYIHLVLGQHGKPVFALFDRNSMNISDYAVYKITLDGTKSHNNIAEYVNQIMVLPGFSNKTDMCIFGIDLGYTEPTAIVIWRISTSGQIRIHARIRMNKVEYFIQQKIIDWLDTKFSPILLAIDEGSAGKAVIPTLTNHEEFLHKNYKERIVPVNFSSTIVLGIDPDGNEIKNKTKPFSVSVLQEYTNNHKIIYSYTDLELITELERMSYTKTPGGDIMYRTLTERGGKRGEDHFTSAMLCAALGYYLKMESITFAKAKAKLARPSWNLVSR